jgi:Domain of unknown function (DUF4326)
MMMSDPQPVRLQLSRKKGFSLQALSLATNGLPAVNVARPSRWGIRFKIGRDDLGWCVYDMSGRLIVRAANKLGAHHLAVQNYRAWIEDWVLASRDGLFAERFSVPLRGRNLGCWCALDGGPCHADFWLEIANRPICEAV